MKYNNKKMNILLNFILFFKFNISFFKNILETVTKNKFYFIGKVVKIRKNDE